MRNNNVLFCSSSLVCLLLYSQLCSAQDMLNYGEKITEDSGGTLVSAGKKFELGFFSPIGSGSTTSSVKKYLGIWYFKLEPRTVVWVANRDKPVADSSGVFRIADDGNVVVIDDASSQSRYWSSDLKEGSSSSFKNRTVKLLDSGNLVLMDDDDSYIWQSFQHPTDTFLPGMKMDANLTLTCWRNDSDPGSGSFTFEQQDTRSQNYMIVIANNLSPIYWALDGDDSESEGITFPIIRNLLENATTYKLSNGSIKQLSYNYEKSRLLMNSSGEIQFLKLEEEIQWVKLWWRGPSDICDTHNYCGSFSSCNKNNWNPCKCLPGFSSMSSELDINGPFQGCFRKSTLYCANNHDMMMFLNLTKIKVGNPDIEIVSETEAKCQSRCLNMCSNGRYQCLAYSYNSSALSDRACSIWTQDLPTLQEDQDGGRDLSILVNSSDIASTKKSCKPCGTNIIPYPLSTGPNCGDPMYNKFNCNYLTGQVSFMMTGGKSYRVTWIDEGDRKFYVQTNGDSDHCNSTSNYQNFKPSSPFNVTSWCFRDDEIEINWLPAPEPPCDDDNCKNWPNSTCNATTGGKNSRCICNSNYQWNASSLICTVHEPSRNHSTYTFPKKNHSTYRRLPLIVAVIFIVMIILACTMVFAYVRRKKIAQKLDRVSVRIQESLDDSERQVKRLIGLASLEENELSEGIEVPYYTFRSILAATDDFSDSNKLGRGGYGPVYKGRFPGGQDIAVKRLSSVSTQGLQEFKNEVVLIAKLQHRNLVRLRGYCVKGDEKILLYEYMPNKSLDTFIFDRTRTVLVDWQLRFEIIQGIARGMLYLHQDSRLRVIHRDLKISNILLDEEMIPKISDFGLAKIFGGKETEASTERVVGTYGYMAPEYALDGFFSIKSDVFSFGVVLLEILSGKRNTGFYESKQISSLLGYAWRLWTENKLLDLMDLALCESCDENQFIKCALIGLLCVQDEPGDRPTMSNVVTMLDSETATIPIPTQPTFFTSKRQSSTSSSSKPEIISMQFDSSYQQGR